MKTESRFIFAIRDGEGYWFSGFDGGEVFFVSPLAGAKRYTNAAKALSERDALAQICGDDTMSVRRIGPTEAVIARSELGDERQINCGAPEDRP